MCRTGENMSLQDWPVGEDCLWWICHHHVASFCSCSSWLFINKHIKLSIFQNLESFWMWVNLERSGSQMLQNLCIHHVSSRVCPLGILVTSKSLKCATVTFLLLSFHHFKFYHMRIRTQSAATWILSNNRYSASPFSIKVTKQTMSPRNLVSLSLPEFRKTISEWSA